jgi:hypothetical protein
MDPRDLDLIKRAIEEALKGQSDAQIMMVCGVLSSVIAVLWAWGFKQSQAWVAKIEELAKDQRSRDDTRDTEMRARYDKIIEGIKTENEKRTERLEAARDLARNQYNSYRDETEKYIKNQLMETTRALEESASVAETTVSQLEKIVYRES